MLALEQSFIGMVGVSLIFYNNPLSLPSLYVTNDFVFVLDESFDIIFILVLFFFWLTTFERIYRKNTY